MRKIFTAREIFLRRRRRGEMVAVKKTFYAQLPVGKNTAVCCGCGKVFANVHLPPQEEVYHEAGEEGDPCGPVEILQFLRQTQ